MILRNSYAFAATSTVAAGLLVVLLASLGSSAQPVPAGASALDVSGVVAAASSPSEASQSNCAYTLTFPSPSSKPEDLPVDFCKELVIVDPAVMAGLGDVSFPNIMSRMFGNRAGSVVASFARSWVDEAPNHGESSRTAVRDALDPNGWKRIKLIAVVNRLDLSPNPEIPSGEGRLIYQLFGSVGHQNMTFILEFDYHPLAGPLGHRGEWAKKWHDLSAASDLGAYTKQLLGVINAFAQPASFRRIRTNEKLSGSAWSFREYAYVPCTMVSPTTTCSASLKWKQLDRTPLDKFHNDNTAKQKLKDYLATVMDALQRGTHKFDTSQIDLDWNAEVGNWFTTTPKDAEKGMLLMAFAACNGCHADFKNHDDRPHISVRDANGHPELSSFLTGEIETKFPLPGCDKAPLLHGCRSVGGKHYWNEQWNRVAYLESLLIRPKGRSSDSTSLPLQSISESVPGITEHHRYH